MIRDLVHPGRGAGFVDDEGKTLEERAIQKYGAKLLPPCLEIVSDPKAGPAFVASVYYFVRAIPADRKQFLSLAIEHLTHQSEFVRRAAVEFVQEVGSERDTGLIVLLLSDEDDLVRRYARETLAKIGGKRDVVAMTIWLKNGNHRNDGGHVRLVKQARDELEKRLKENPIPKDLKD
jgi:HEAT repeat protein